MAGHKASCYMSDSTGDRHLSLQTQTCSPSCHRAQSAEATFNFIIPYLKLTRYVLMLNVSAFHTAISYWHFSTNQLQGTVQHNQLPALQMADIRVTQPTPCLPTVTC
jgi:hypothetical protein